MVSRGGSLKVYGMIDSFRDILIMGGFCPLPLCRVVSGEAAEGHGEGPGFGARRPGPRTLIWNLRQGTSAL